MTTSPFLTPPSRSQDNSLALLSLRRDQTIPILLHASNPSNPSDPIANTRFGSYPHSTLQDQRWGIQVVASNVGARERKRGKKRKRDQVVEGTEAQDDEQTEELEPAFEAATSGFAHLLPPTPETWTVSLPHRTQVVYTPDYSYVLQRIRAQPGDRIIEAGAGSGSFTHAAVRAVFSGYPLEDGTAGQYGKVFSFEYHEPRYVALTQEIKEHGLERVVRITHRDVYEDGFLVQDEAGGQNVTSVFLDLPAPWIAIPKLARRDGPLHPERPVYLCSFSPCIEQAQKAAGKLRDIGWVDIGMTAMHHKRIDVRRDRIGLQEEGLRGVNAVAASVEEALSRLRDLESKQNEYHATRRRQKSKANGVKQENFTRESKQQRRDDNVKKAETRKLYKEGVLVHRTEPELKTHTSYLVFATLPREWTEEDERLCEEKLASRKKVETDVEM